MQIILRLMGMGGNMRRLAYAKSLEDQRAAWESAWFIRFLKGAPTLLVRVFIKLLSLIFFNRVVLWCGPSLLTRYVYTMVIYGCHVTEHFIGKRDDH